MNTRIASYIALFTPLAVWALLQILGGPDVFLLAFIMLAAALFLSAIVFMRATRQADRPSRNRSLGGMVLNAAYLALIGYIVFVIIPDTRRLALQLQQEAAAKQQEQQALIFQQQMQQQEQDKLPQPKPGN